MDQWGKDKKASRKRGKKGYEKKASLGDSLPLVHGCDWLELNVGPEDPFQEEESSSCSSSHSSSSSPSQSLQKETIDFEKEKL